MFTVPIVTLKISGFSLCPAAREGFTISLLSLNVYRREIALLILVIVQIIEVEVLTEVFWVVRRLRRLMLQLSVAIQTRQEELELLPKELLAPPQDEVGFEDQLQLRVEVLVVEIVEEHDDELLPLLGFEYLVKYFLKLDLLPLVLEEVL